MEALETQVDLLPDELKSFIALNTAQNEKMIQCFLLKEKLWPFEVAFGVLALTNHNLLLKGDLLRFSLFKQSGSDWVYIGIDPEKWHIIRLSQIRKTDHNNGWKRVYVDYSAFSEKGVRFAIGIELSNKAQTESFANLLKKVLAEYSVAPLAVKSETLIPDIADQLKKLTELRKGNMITDEEYEVAKRKLLS